MTRCRACRGRAGHSPECRVPGAPSPVLQYTTGLFCDFDFSISMFKWLKRASNLQTFVEQERLACRRGQRLRYPNAQKAAGRRAGNDAPGKRLASSGSSDCDLTSNSCGEGELRCCAESRSGGTQANIPA